VFPSAILDQRADRVAGDAAPGAVLRELFESETYQQSSSLLTIAMGTTSDGEPYVTDLRAMPHLLMGGTEGSVRWRALHTLLVSLLFRATPEQTRIVLIDTKAAYLVYQDIPHLLTPVIAEADHALGAFWWALQEMEKRYQTLGAAGVRNIQQYNLVAEATRGEAASRVALPNIVIAVDDIADLVMVDRRRVDRAIAAIAQMGRAVGIHVMAATSVLSVGGLTGQMKANMPARIAFKVGSGRESLSILDRRGAELLEADQGLFLPPASVECVRLHFPDVSRAEIVRVARFLRDQGRPALNETVTGLWPDADREPEWAADELYPRAVRIVLATGDLSISRLQHRLKIGFSRAADMLHRMKDQGLVP
jgi:S-DNA-T family DNA segregation ATPase FtsK/SpoIIIE